MEMMEAVRHRAGGEPARVLAVVGASRTRPGTLLKLLWRFVHGAHVQR
jgi:hypothetical protein